MIRCSLERRLKLISDVEHEKSSDISYKRSRGPTPTHSTVEIRGLYGIKGVAGQKSRTGGQVGGGGGPPPEKKKFDTPDNPELVPPHTLTGPTSASLSHPHTPALLLHLWNDTHVTVPFCTST